MSIHNNVKEIESHLYNLQKSGMYDAEKCSCSLLHLVAQLDYFYCNLVPKSHLSSSEFFYKIKNRPREHQLAYINIGRGFPKELMDGHWCYIVKDFGSKMLVVPAVSIKGDGDDVGFMEKDIDVTINNKKTKSRLQIGDLRTIDIQRIDIRKNYGIVHTSRKEIMNNIQDLLFKD